jgi:hypothetical protein
MAGNEGLEIFLELYLQLCLDVFINEKANYYSFSEDVKRLTEQQAFKYFAKSLANELS